MAQPLTLKVRIVEQNVTKVIQFDSSTLLFDACHIVREKITDANLSQPKDYGLFLPGEDGQGVWLEPGRELRYYYLLKNQDLIEYRRKIRQLKVRMLDGMIKTLMVDDSQPVSQMMVYLYNLTGIMNHDEYSLVREVEQEEIENKPNFGTLTLRRKKEGEKERDVKMENLKKKLRTDDEINWVDHSKTLREQGINENEVLLLRRKYFFSDGNIDSQDPIQLNLLYVQCRDDIINGTHPVTQEKACEFAGIQCQVQFGDYNEGRHKPGFLEFITFLTAFREFLPHSYIKVKGIEKKVFNHHKMHSGKSELDAKFRYVEEARSLKTYDFGDYSDQYYPFQTTEGEQIAQLIAGYIDIILKKQRPVGHIGIEGDEGLALQEDNVVPMTPNIIQHWDNHEAQHLEQESISRPAIIRPGVQVYF
ncbi:Talin-1 [Armadillidium vulgare]|nr:Talin-1 [Armadillidium vulgare]